MNCRLSIFACFPVLTSLRLVNAQRADLIITNARIHAVDENRPLVDAMPIREDIMRIPPKLVLSTSVRATHLGGRAVYQKPVP